jgi:hypothetical protein
VQDGRQRRVARSPSRVQHADRACGRLRMTQAALAGEQRQGDQGRRRRGGAVGRGARGKNRGGRPDLNRVSQACACAMQLQQIDL